GLTFLSAFPAIAASARVPFVLLGVGVGPLATDEGRRYTRLIFERASLATVRDAESRDLLAAIGVDPDRVHVTADPAFLLPDLKVRPPNPLDPPHRIAVVLRAWDRGVDVDTWQREVAGALDRLVETRGTSVLFVPFQSTPEDPLTD